MGGVVQIARRGKYGNKFCSKECSNKYKNKDHRTTFNCYNCGKEVTRDNSKFRNSKHGFYFCSRECKEKSQSIKGNCPEIRPSHYGDGDFINYRKLVGDRIEKCEICGEDFPPKIVVHYIDGNRRNNDESNLEVVCFNCHIIRHMKEIDGEWTFNYSFLTSREIVDKIDKGCKWAMGLHGVVV